MFKRLDLATFPIYEKDVNILDERGNPPIYYAAKNGNTDMVR